ncbi:MAG TPA: DUF3551 domain-containing protein [Xanthobacteraceae bacterium]|nr:DUF3551 domain-containing protein [Xanthobacteraceae bacterium]
MSKVAFAFAAAMVFTALAACEAAAGAYCAYAGGPMSFQNCGFDTFEQCRAAVSGAGGHCMRNPRDPSWWGPNAPPPPYKTRRYPNG